MAEPAGYCWHCDHPLAATDYTREGECPQCRRQTHVCRNCRFYQPGLHNDCREPVAEPVLAKDRANFCDYFAAHPEPRRLGADSPPAEDLLAAAQALFDDPD